MPPKKISPQNCAFYTNSWVPKRFVPNLFTSGPWPPKRAGSMLVVGIMGALTYPTAYQVAAATHAAPPPWPHQNRPFWTYWRRVCQQWVIAPLAIDACRLVGSPTRTLNDGALLDPSYRPL